MKKKITDKLLSMTADVALETAIAAAGLPSAGGTYQHKEPVGLQEMVQNHVSLFTKVTTKFSK